MLFLVKGVVTFTPYMCLDRREDALRLVEANNANEAHAKFERHFDDKTVPYGDSYSARATSASEVIT